MKVVRQKFCMHLERGEMPVTKAVKNWRLFLSESVEMGKKADDRREREEVLVQQILAFLYTGFAKVAERGGGGKGETPHGSSGHPPLFYRVCPCGA